MTQNKSIEEFEKFRIWLISIVVNHCFNHIIKIKIKNKKLQDKSKQHRTLSKRIWNKLRKDKIK